MNVKEEVLLHSEHLQLLFAFTNYNPWHKLYIPAFPHYPHWLQNVPPGSSALEFCSLRWCKITIRYTNRRLAWTVWGHHEKRKCIQQFLNGRVSWHSLHHCAGYQVYQTSSYFLRGGINVKIKHYSKLGKQCQLCGCAPFDWEVFQSTRLMNWIKNLKVRNL